MDIPSQTIIDVLTFLLPGFVTAAVLYRLTPTPRPAPFERVIQALIFTILIQALVVGVETSLLELGATTITLGTWTDRIRLAWSFGLALVLASVIAWADNNDILHSVLRKFRITYQSSYPSEWYGTFAVEAGYLVLHITGGRRLLGWVVEWPNQPDRGHFVLAEAEWLLDSGETIPVKGVRRMLVRATDVEMVELMEPVPDNGAEGDQNGRQQATQSTAK